MAGSASTAGKLRRVWRHRWGAGRSAAVAFDAAAFERIEEAIGLGERLHRGEIRFALEAELDLYRLWANMTPRERALQVFGEQLIWDTEGNTGVLVYLLWADHAVEIVADRAAAAALPADRWQQICSRIVDACRDGRPVDGVIAGIESIHDALGAVLPMVDLENPDELSNRPLRL